MLGRSLFAVCLGFRLLTGAAQGDEPFAGTPPPKPSPATAQTVKPEPFLRLVRDDKGTVVGMEVAIVRFVPRNRSQAWPVVDLVGAVHIADSRYYAALNRQFAGYDAVLYELIAAEGTQPQPGQSSGSPVSLIQRGLKDLLGLQFQLDTIHYNRPNMIHADVSPEQLAQAMQQRGESVLAIFMRMLGYAMAQQGKAGTAGEADIIMALLDKNRSLALKRLVAEQFEAMDGSLMALSGPDGSSIIEDRNTVALNVLRKQLVDKRKLAIFYGAGHLNDFARRLSADFGLERTNTRWLLAWDMHDPTPVRRPPATKPQ